MVKIYSTSWCPTCIKLKKYLELNNVKYEEVNVADKQEDRDEVLRVSGQRTVPVLDVNNKIIVGFNKKEIDDAIKSI